MPVLITRLAMLGMLQMLIAADGGGGGGGGAGGGFAAYRYLLRTEANDLFGPGHGPVRLPAWLIVAQARHCLPTEKGQCRFYRRNGASSRPSLVGSLFCG